MKRTHGLIAALVAAMALAPATTAHAQDAQRAAPRQIAPAPTEAVVRPVQVASQAGWVRTGIRVAKGGQIQILVRDGRQPIASPNFAAAGVRLSAPGALGFPNTAGQDALPLPAANRGAVIGRIGDGPPFLIGARYAGVAGADGVLEIATNDDPRQRKLLDGAIAAIVRYAPPPPTTTTPTTPTPTRDPAKPTRPAEPPPSTTPPSTQQPTGETTPPTTRPPATRPPATEPAAPARPPTTKPPATEPAPPTRAPPAAEPAPPLETPPAAEAPPIVTEPAPPPPVAEPPAVETPVATPAPPDAQPPEASPPALPLVPIGIAIAALAGLLLLSSLLRPRKNAKANAAAAAGVSTRIARDGRSGQSLTISVERT
jgi:hypothetical protein